MKILPFILLLPFYCQAQTLISRANFPQQQVNEALQKAWKEKDFAQPVTTPNTKTNNKPHSGIFHLLQQQQQARSARQSWPPQSPGIFYVGATPHDTLIVTGNWQNNGIVAVVNDGVLIFDSAHATISGDLIVTGYGKIIATNSYFFFPQQYFYEWGMQAVENGLLQMRHCTLDFNDMATPIGTSDSGTMYLQNVHFTSSASTIGLNGHSSFIVDTADVLGEIVASDTILLSLKNVDTVIVWHRVQRGAGLTWTFPDGFNLQHYAIGPDSAGVTGLQYTVALDNIAQVHWAVMPENGTDVNISNSNIRSVAVIYRGTDVGTAQGLIDHSTYLTSPTFFTDRNFQLNNCTLETWGIYPTDTTYVDITSCIAGEIGTSGMGHTSCSSMFCDGSGGYFWASGFGFQSASGCGFSCPVRAEQGGTMLVGFGSISAATGYAIDSGLLIMVQTPTISPPIAYDGSDIWVGMLAPQTANVGDTVLFTGSAYILRGPSSNLMSFASYYLAYQAPGDSTYTMIGNVSTTPITQNTLGTWPTSGLVPGNYSLILIIKDNYGDSVTVNSGITLQAQVNGIATVENPDVKVFPNPACDMLTISTDQTIHSVTLFNMLGQKVFEYACLADSKTSLTIDISNVPAGIYVYRITKANEQVVEGKVVKM